MSHSQFHCTGRVYLDLHGLIFETSICYWQDQPGSPDENRAGRPAPTGRPTDDGPAHLERAWLRGSPVREPGCEAWDKTKVDVDGLAGETDVFSGETPAA